MSNLFYDYVNNKKKNELDDNQVKALLVDYRLNHNLDARDRLADNFYPLIKHLIISNVHDISKREEFISVAYMALSNCMDKFDLESPYKFSTVAQTYIVNAIRHELFKSDSLINVPYVEIVNAKKYLTAKKKLEDSYGRKLTVDEMADLLGLKPNKILDYETELADIYSLNQPLAEDITLGDVVRDKYSLEEEVEIKENIETLMNNISLLKDKRKQLIVMYTYGLIDGVEHTQEEARKMLQENGYGEMSRQNVQKLQKTAIKELREMYN